jgi:hypothetical protein
MRLRLKDLPGAQGPDAGNQAPNRVPARINLVQAFSDDIRLLAREKVRQGGSI